MTVGYIMYSTKIAAMILARYVLQMLYHAQKACPKDKWCPCVTAEVDILEYACGNAAGQ